MSESNEFSATAITPDKLVAWPRIAAVSAMVALSLPTFITGLEVYLALSPLQAGLALVLGSIIIFAIGSTMGVIGARTHMSSYLLVRVAFGDKGAGIVNIAFAISLLGWFGININLFADAAERLSSEVFGFTLPSLIWISVASACMTLTTLIGFRAINILAIAMAPILAIVTAMLVFSSLQTLPLAALLAIDKPITLTLGQGISTVVGAIIIGAIILPDITRFARHWSGAIYTALISFLIVQIIVMIGAGLAAASSGETEILGVMLSLGMGLGAFAIVIAGSWVLNSLNLYSAVLSVKATIPKLNTTGLTISLGVIGIAVGLLNILDYFVTFLFYLSIIFVPVAGVIIIDYLLIRPKSYCIETLSCNRSFSPKGFSAWAVGAIAAVLMSESILPSLTGMAAMDSMILSGGLYLLFSWNERQRPSDQTHQEHEKP